MSESARGTSYKALFNLPGATRVLRLRGWEARGAPWPRKSENQLHQVRTFLAGEREDVSRLVRIQSQSIRIDQVKLGYVPHL